MKKFLVLTGDGINCERETKICFEDAGASVDVYHVEDLIKKKIVLGNYGALVFPGGFSYGDELGSGSVMTLKLLHHLKEDLQYFIKSKRPILGVCNGLQILAKLGVLPNGSLMMDEVSPTPLLRLAKNKQNHFIDCFVEMKIHQSKCIWTKGISTDDDAIDLRLPIRHGEGRFLFHENEVENILQLERLKAQGQVVLQYEKDMNGSVGALAGICDPTGLILGLMPHPEAAYFPWQLPRNQENKKTRERRITLGKLIIQNGVDYVQESSI